MGSMNFGLFPMLNRFKEFKHDWERPSRELARSCFRNTFAGHRIHPDHCAENGTRFEFECYDIGHLYNLNFLDAAWSSRRCSCRRCSASSGGIGAHPEDVLHMKRTADRLFGDKYRWSVLGAGRNQMPIAAMAAAMGGNVRVGLEDSLWAAPGRLAESNAEQVHTRAQDHRGPRPRGRDLRRGARDPGPQGRRQAGSVTAPYGGTREAPAVVA
jgi:uncharacterized protein (DUF849 family)